MILGGMLTLLIATVAMVSIAEALSRIVGQLR